MRRAAETPGLWEEMRARVPRLPSHSIEEDLEIMTNLYRGLMQGREAAPATAREAIGGA
jgi:hypothetical protein